MQPILQGISSLGDKTFELPLNIVTTAQTLIAWNTCTTGFQPWGRGSYKQPTGNPPSIASILYGGLIP